MAKMLEVSCGRCGAEGIQLNGPTLSGYQPRCEQCGEARLVPPFGQPGRADLSGLSGEALAARIANEAGTCSCGGHFSVDAPLRCSVCRSTDVSTTFAGVAD